jgi:transposase
VVGEARKHLAPDYLGELEGLDAPTQRPREAPGRGPRRAPDNPAPDQRGRSDHAAKIFYETGDVPRFPCKAHFASYTGTAPIELLAARGAVPRRRRSR